MRRLRSDAAHNCWAYAAGAPGDTARVGSSDDGEPHGTAGRPMLQVLLHCGIGEICLVVTRWFGGIKLGTGGLVRAYQDSARENLATLTTAEHAPQAQLALTLEYMHLDGLRRLLAAHEARLTAEDYQAVAHVRLSLPQECVSAFETALAGLTNGTAICHRLDKA